MSDAELPTPDPDSDLGLGDFCAPAEEHGVSLDELAAAFAGVMDKGSDPYEQPPATTAVASEEPLAIEEEPASANDCSITPKTILEAMLFVGHPNNEPLTSRQVAALMRGVRPQEIDALVNELNATYREEGCPYHIVSVGAGYQLALHEQYAPLRDKFYGRVKDARLSQAAVDVLAIVAYRQPISREEIDALRGKPSSGVLSQLVRRRLLRIERSRNLHVERTTSQQIVFSSCSACRASMTCPKAKTKAGCCRPHELASWVKEIDC